jgi:hypothetical protein
MKIIMRFLAQMLALNLILVPVMVFAPLIYLTVPFYNLIVNPGIDLSGLALLLFWIGPLSCAFYMLVSCHWQTVHLARREGRLATWRQDAGGYGCTIPKAFAYMVLGLFGSFFTETVFVLLYRMPNGRPWGLLIWFGVLPFASFAPLLLLWLRRWQRSREVY